MQKCGCLFVTYDDQCCQSVLLVSTTKSVLENSVSSYYDVLFHTIIVWNSTSSKQSPSHRKLKKSIEEVGTDFLLLPNAFTQVTLEIMSNMAGRHQLITLSGHGGGEKFSQSLQAMETGINSGMMCHLHLRFLPHLLLLLKITIKFLANVYTVKTCSSECEVAHVHHQIQIRHQYKAQTKS